MNRTNYDMANYHLANKDISMSLYFFDLSAEEGNCQAIKYLLDYFSGHGNEEQCIKYYDLLAKKNDMMGLIKMGEYYENRNINLMKEYYTMAISVGYAKCFEQLCFSEVDQSAESKDCFPLATVILRLAKYYFQVENNTAACDRYCGMAFDIKHPVAMRKIGSFAQNVMKDLPRAVNFYTEAMNNGDTKSAIKLGDIHLRDKNYERAKFFYNIAIETRNKYTSQAIIKMGNLYKLLDDDNNMIKYYEFASDLKNPNAMLLLGNYYKTVCNYNLMEAYYIMASKLNNVEAMHHLGQYNELVTKNYKEAMKYYSSASYLGYKESSNSLISLRNRIDDGKYFSALFNQMVM